MEIVTEEKINKMFDIIVDIYKNNAEYIDNNKRENELKRALTIFAEDIQRETGSKVRNLLSDIINKF